MDDLGSWCLLISAACVFLTTFFSVLYQSLRHISWVKLEEVLNARERRGQVQIIHERLSSLIYTMATLRLLANLGLLLCLTYDFLVLPPAAVHARPLIPLLEAFLVTALILLVFSVALPQAWARYAGTKMIVSCYAVLMGLDTIFRPLTAMLQLIDPLVRRLAGIRAEPGNGRREEDQDELLSVVEKQKKEGRVDEEEREMIASVLEFRNTTIEEIMTPRTEVVGIEADADLAEAIKIIVAHGHSRYPVYEKSMDNIIGMLYAKDLLRDLDRAGENPGVRKRLRPPYFVPESKSLPDLLHDFQNQKVHLAVVLDEYGGTAGVVTIEDILEELVGEIVDEYEPEQRESLVRISENAYEVDARYHVDELNERLEINIPEDEDYETVGGFAFSKLGAIPQKGEGFDHEKLHFTVIEAGPRKINRLRIDVAVEPEDRPSETT